MTSDIAKLRSLRATLEEMERPGSGTADDQAIAAAKGNIDVMVDAWPDEKLIDTYEASSGEVGDAEADALLAGIKWWNLDP